MPIDITNLKSQLQTQLNSLTEDSTIEDVLLLSKTINQFVGDGVDYTNFRAALQSQVDNLSPSSPIKDILLISKSLESSASSITTSDILLTGNNQIAYITSVANNQIAYITSVANNIINSIQSIYEDDISLKANLASPTFTGTVSGITKTMVGLGDVDNTADSAKNVLSATTLTTARTIELSGDVSGSASFDGSANATITTTVADDSHNHIIGNVDGLQTALDGKQASGSYLTAVPAATSSTYGGLKVSLSGTTLTITV